MTLVAQILCRGPWGAWAHAPGAEAGRPSGPRGSRPPLPSLPAGPPPLVRTPGRPGGPHWSLLIPSLSPLHQVRRPCESFGRRPASAHLRVAKAPLARARRQRPLCRTHRGRLVPPRVCRAPAAPTSAGALASPRLRRAGPSPPAGLTPVRTSQLREPTPPRPPSKGASLAALGLA